MVARARKSDTKITAGEIDLGAEADLTLFRDMEHSAVLNRLPTMFPQLDYILGGGLPFGRFVEVYGKNSSGKSTIAVHLTKICQMLEVPCVWVDIEGTADPIRTAELGVDFEAGGVWFVEPKKKKNPTTGKMEKEVLTLERVAEKVLATVKAFAPSGKPIVIIWDSISQTITQSELDKGVGDKQPGVQAKALTQFAKNIAPIMTNSQVLFIGINQARDEMGSMFGGITTSGGHALHHWASLRLEVKKAKKIEGLVPNAFGKEQKDYIGHIMRVHTEKSKVSRPKQKAEMYLMTANGLNFEENVYRACHAPNQQYCLISGGGWRTYKALDGSVVKFQRDSDWVDFLRTPEGQPILKELFGRMMATSFPSGFSPYDNRDVDITKIPLYKEIKDYAKTYGGLMADVPVDTPATDPESVETLLDKIVE